MKPPIILLMIVTLFSCRKNIEKPYVPIVLCSDLTDNKDTIDKYIYGTWEWVEQKLFATQTNEYVYQTPKTEGYTFVLNFSGDTAKFYKNNLLTTLYRFQIQKEKEITNWPDDNKTVMVYYDFATGQRQNYFRIETCKNYFVQEQSYRSDAAWDVVWKRK
jgi:hypothetical protein